MASVTHPQEAANHSTFGDAIDRLSAFGRFDDREQHIPARHPIARVSALSMLIIAVALTLAVLIR